MPPVTLKTVTGSKMMATLPAATLTRLAVRAVEGERLSIVIRLGYPSEWFPGGF